MQGFGFTWRLIPYPFFRIPSFVVSLKSRYPKKGVGYEPRASGCGAIGFEF